MFSDTSDSIKFGNEFVLQQRVRDIATKGFSTISLPKPGKKPSPSKIEPAIALIRDAIDHQEDYLSGLTMRIHHTARLMECLYGKDDKMAISTMQKTKQIQHEYVHILRVIAGMKAFQNHIELGLIAPGVKNVEKSIKEIEDCPWKNNPSTAGKDALVAMVGEKRYFPVMSSGGKIGLSSKPLSLGGSETGSVSESFSAASSTLSTITASSSLASPRRSFS
ncbi:unnamed protein product [Cylindrotheca closterium]|uniref:Uncharacterized protein n=1 Tax=Cylindrotheca closterium TaxID=2856 RepID=A0AAD2CTH1_9STRA|nr:unnamed protein product [Cylindrotheca closterium]CAJ1948619.1 unnamed protein product [Cylindrotheca closterium]